MSSRDALDAGELFGGGSWGQKDRGIYGYGRQQREASVRLGLGADLSDLLMDSDALKRELKPLEGKKA